MNVDGGQLLSGERKISRYSLHGLCVGSEIPLPAPVCGKAIDLRVLWGSEQDKEGALRGSLLAQVQLDGGGHTLVAAEGGWILRHTGVCDFRISSDTRLITVDLAPGGNSELVPVILSSNVFAFLLALRGDSVLHASAIEMQGRTIAIVGASGMGKSTLSALFCAEGAQLISDDLLRVESTGNRAFCFLGTGLIRLRATATELADLFAARTRATTSDGRIGVMLPRPAKSRFQLDAIVVPAPSRSAQALTVRRLTQRDALVELLRYPRALGWSVAEPTRQFFLVAAMLARIVPVFTARIPWGPPFDPEIPRSLLERIDQQMDEEGATIAG